MRPVETEYIPPSIYPGISSYPRLSFVVRCKYPGISYRRPAACEIIYIVCCKQLAVSAYCKKSDALRGYHRACRFPCTSSIGGPVDVRAKVNEQVPFIVFNE